MLGRPPRPLARHIGCPPHPDCRVCPGRNEHDTVGGHRQCIRHRGVGGTHHGRHHSATHSRQDATQTTAPADIAAATAATAPTAVAAASGAGRRRRPVALPVGQPQRDNLAGCGCGEQGPAASKGERGRV
eukprot:scaffold9544_cov73-Isochrysis_galbana.AAC.1